MRASPRGLILPLLALITAFVLVLAVTPRAARAQIGGGGGCLICEDDTTPPTASISPTGGTYTTATHTITIRWCDEESPLGVWSVKLNGQTVSSDFSYDLGDNTNCSGSGGSNSLSTGQVTLQAGSNTLVAHICDTNDNCANYSRSYTLNQAPPPPPTVSVTPDNGTTNAPANATTTQYFAVTRTGGASGGATYTLTAQCSGTASCGSGSVTPSTVTLSTGQSANGAVTYYVGAGGTTGTVRLTATYNSTTHDAGSVTVTSQVVCTIAEATVAPCNQSHTVLTNASGIHYTLTLTNHTSFPLSYTMSCTPGGPVTSCSGPDGALNAGESQAIEVTINTGAGDGAGTAHFLVTTGGGKQVAADVSLQVLSTTSVVVTTSATPTHVDAGANASRSFNVRNAGYNNATYQLVLVCTGIVTQCSTSSTQITLAAGSSTNRVVNFVASSTGGSGTVALRATDTRSTAITRTATASVVEDHVASSVALSAYNGDSYDPMGCVLACFHATASYTTPGYTSLDVARSVTLVYSSATADPRPIVQADVLDPSGIQAGTISLRLLGTNSQYQTFANASQEMFFTNAHALRRLAVQFDPNALLATGAHPYTLIVTNSWPDTTWQTDVPVRVLVDNQRNSPFGAGWSVAGLAHLTLLGD